MTTQPRRVLITAKTYPNPSDKYEETVCTAGIDLDTCRFVRLYPLRFRNLPYESQFKKWDILEMELKRKTADPRGDTFTPNHETIRCVDHIDTGRKRDWVERNDIVLPLVSTIEQLKVLAGKRVRSLGVVRVHSGGKLAATPDDENWTPKQAATGSVLALTVWLTTYRPKAVPRASRKGVRLRFRFGTS